MAQLKGEGTLHCTAAQKSAIVMWRTIENRQHHSVGGWVGGWSRKEGSSGPAGPPEKGGQKSLWRGALGAQ